LRSVLGAYSYAVPGSSRPNCPFTAAKSTSALFESAEAWTTIFGIVAFFVVLLSDLSIQQATTKTKKNGRSHESLIAAGLVHLETQTEGLLGQGLHSSKRSSAQEGRELRAWQVGQCAIFTSTTVLECRKNTGDVFFSHHFFSANLFFHRFFGTRRFQEGVESIGAFLYHSKTMLVLWDPSYVRTPCFWWTTRHVAW
jgi:hypothetical protein